MDGRRSVFEVVFDEVKRRKMRNGKECKRKARYGLGDESYSVGGPFGGFGGDRIGKEEELGNE